MPGAMSEPIFDPAAASGPHGIAQGPLHLRQIIGMDLNQGVTSGQTLDRISKHPCVGRVIPHSSALSVDYCDQVIDVIDDQFQQSQISTKSPFLFVFH